MCASVEIMHYLPISTEARQIPSNALPGAVGLLESGSRHYGVNEVMVVGCQVDNHSTLRARSCPRIRPQIDEQLRIETRPSNVLLVLLPISIGPTQASRSQRCPHKKRSLTLCLPDLTSLTEVRLGRLGRLGVRHLTPPTVPTHRSSNRKQGGLRKTSDIS